ncbi:MAG: hypothetical protein Tsb002_20080 [Wenzhouxiangellaceae bacterium]
MKLQYAAIEQRLRELDRPASISEIGATLDVPERTLRRWLASLTSKGVVLASGQKKGRRYQLAGSLSGQKTEAPPKPINRDGLPAYQANESSYFSASQRQQLEALITSSNGPAPADEDKRQWFVSGAYHSGRIEGLAFDRDDTMRLAQQDQLDDDQIDHHHIQLFNLLTAWRLLMQRPVPDPFTSDDLRALNFVLCEGLMAPSQAAGFNTNTASANHANRLQTSRRLGSILHLANAIEHPFEQSLFLMAHISLLAPFAGANTATARLAANWPLLRHGWPPLMFSGCSVDDYQQALDQLTVQHDIAPLARLYCVSYQQDCQSLSHQQSGPSIDALRVRWRKQRQDLIRQIIASDASCSSYRFIREWCEQNQIPAELHKAFAQSIIDDLARLAPFNLPAFGIEESEWREWRRRCLQSGIRFARQLVTVDDDGGNN